MFILIDGSLCKKYRRYRCIKLYCFYKSLTRRMCTFHKKKASQSFLLLLTGEFSRNELLNILMFHKINILSPLLHYFQYFTFEEIGEGLECAYPQMTNMSNISIEYMMAGD